VNGSKLKPKKTRRELESSLNRVGESLGSRVQGVESTLALLTKAHTTIWENQRELAKSEELLDEQFAVLTRLAISNLNYVIQQVNGVQITETDVENLFKDWAKFKARPDRKSLMMEWFMGVALDKLPPLLESKPQEEGGSNAEGNNRDTDATEELPQDSGDGQEDDVPQV
jgi:hypothetical protein